MHLASYFHDGAERMGFKVDDDHLIDLAEAARAAPGMLEYVPADMASLIAGGDDLRDAIAQLAKAAPANGAMRTRLDAIRWRPPVPNPGKIVGVAMNNSASNARKISAPSHPMFFIKPSTCLLGHREPIIVRSYYGGLHPEPELAVVIGKSGRRIDPREALDHVFGYTILNDMTGNVMRSEDMVHYYALYASKDDPDQLERREQHLSYAARYKGTDGFGPMGPWLVTRDALDPAALAVTCTVGGDVIAEDSTAYLTYTVAEIIAFLSRFQTLEPGNVIAMGTAFRPSRGSNRSLHTADLQRRDGPVRVTIAGIGTIENPVERIEEDLGEWRLPR